MVAEKIGLLVRLISKWWASYFYRYLRLLRVL